MKNPYSAIVGAAFGVAFVLGTGSAWSAQTKDSNTQGTVAAGATAPTTETVLTAPISGPQAQPAAIQAPQVPEQQAGMAKPVRVYWFLSGR